MINTPCTPQGTQHHDTGVYLTLRLIGGKYKVVILYWLAQKNVVRFNELRRLIGKISYKTLSATLKELEKDKLITRTEYPQIPPKVEYRLSEQGETLIPVLNAMCSWGYDYRAMNLMDDE